MNDLVVFDFDWSLINENSDTWIFEKLVPCLHDEMRTLSSSEYKNSWTRLMDYLVGKMISDHSISIQQIRECLCDIPIYAEVIHAIRFAQSQGADIRILSDANDFYIDTILRHHSIDDAFTDIVTNRAAVNETHSDGDATGAVQPSIRILPFQDPDTPHQCPLCPPNLCKGGVLDRWMKDSISSSARRVIYIGDGRGDICPATRLTPTDWLLCRKDWQLHRAAQCHPASKSGAAICAQVAPWENGADMLTIFYNLYSSH